MIKKDIGFILRRYNFRNTSLIASIYTLNFGKILGIFKGFYTQKKEFSSHLGIFSLNEFVFYPKKRELWLVSQTDLICDFYFLWKNFKKNEIATICSLLIDKIMPLWEANKEVFYLFKQTLESLDKKDIDIAFFAFLLKFLTFSGFKPQLNRCISCEGALKDDLFFSIAKGGLLCQECYKKVEDWQKVSPNIARSLLYLQDSSFPLVFNLQLTDACKKEISFILKQFLSYHLDLNFLKF
ncbi:MAG: DNA repair protein RecO [Candidatus Omnitrophica bacterium]|nr:DNA repair protein RecO [Candidatus Omnitrophota bacterium]MCM8831161.1 DNA repair protein RecO [Candidatus Omnitrophota bacterium]